MRREAGFYWVRSREYSDGEPEVCLWDVGTWGQKRWHFTREGIQVAGGRDIEVLSPRLTPPEVKE